MLCAAATEQKLDGTASKTGQTSADEALGCSVYVLLCRIWMTLDADCTIVWGVLSTHILYRGEHQLLGPALQGVVNGVNCVRAAERRVTMCLAAINSNLFDRSVGVGRLRAPQSHEGGHPSLRLHSESLGQHAPSTHLPYPSTVPVSACTCNSILTEHRPSVQRIVARHPIRKCHLAGTS
jgi:hypothetical protein